MVYTLENEWLRITVREQGAELRSLAEKADGTEYLWNGDPVWWKYSSPVLFPIVGKLAAGTYRVDGREYELPAHGLGRISEFRLVGQTTGSLTFALQWSPVSLQHYPYKFRLEISYVLQGKEVQVKWKVRNLDKHTMYFSIGAHPALRCPIVSGERLTDCYLEFSSPEKAGKLAITPDCLLTHNRVPALDGRTQELSDEFFREGVLVFDDLRSDSITIRSRKSEKSLTVKANGFPYWGIWAPEKGGAPFICIEPWYGHADYADFVGEFAEKEGNQSLRPDNIFTAEYKFIIGSLTTK